MTTHVVKGRSIEGTVYMSSYGWDSYHCAKRMTLVEALAAIEAQQNKNRMADSDDIIGRLEALPFSQEKHDKSKAYESDDESFLPLNE